MKTRTTVTPVSYNTCMTHFKIWNTTSNRKKGCLNCGTAMTKKDLTVAWPTSNEISLHCDHDKTREKTIQFYI